VDGQLAVARAFGDKSLKVHLSAQPDIKRVTVDDRTDLLILASDGLWKVDIFAQSKLTLELSSSLALCQ
jgi:protein phosphatase 1L